MRIDFHAYPAKKTVKFTCAECGAKKRSKTFTVECTVNPFNRDESGKVRGPDEVRQQSRDEAEQRAKKFLAKPLCSKCDDQLGFSGRKALSDERETILAARGE